MWPRAVLYTVRATKTAQCRLRQSRDVLYRTTPYRMPHAGVIWILAAIVWYSAVLYGGWPHNYKFGFLLQGVPHRRSQGSRETTGSL